MESKKTILSMFIGVVVISFVAIQSNYSKNMTMKMEQFPKNKQQNIQTPKSTNRKSTKCEPVRHLVFAKTHKTGSSSTLSVMQHHVRKHELRMARTFPGPYIGGYPGSFNSKYVFYKDENGEYSSYVANNKKPDVIASHQRYNRKELNKIMPRHTKYLTIVRNPVQQIPSAFAYYYSRAKTDLYNCFNSPYSELFNNIKGKSFLEYLDIPNENINETVPFYFRSRGFQSYDLGLDVSKDYSEPQMEEMMDELNKQFDLVLITDYFAESMILLKKQLCLDWQTIAWENLKRGNRPHTVYSQRSIEKMKQKSKLDFYLYDYFNRTFWQKVEEYGRAEMAEDMRILKEHMNSENAFDEIHETITIDETEVEVKETKPFRYEIPRGYKKLKDPVEDMIQRIEVRATRGDNMAKLPPLKELRGLAKQMLSDVPYCKTYESKTIKH